MKKGPDDKAARVSISMPIRYWKWVNRRVAADMDTFKSPSGFIQWLVNLDIHPEKKVNSGPKHPTEKAASPTGMLEHDVPAVAGKKLRR